MSHRAPATDPKILNAENIISYQFHDQHGLRNALDLTRNRNLAQLGDAIIHSVLIYEGICRPATREQISDVVASKASNAYLAQRGFSTALAGCVYTNPAQGNNIYQNPMADTVEAVIGAVFHDSCQNISVVEGVMNALGISWSV